jgi:hypothetical protein
MECGVLPRTGARYAHSAAYSGRLAGRPRRNGPCSAPQASTSMESQTGVAANRASGSGKSSRLVYWRADDLLT